MKVCIVSDSHDNRPLLAAAVAQAMALGAEAVLHCGDVVAPSTLFALQPYPLPVHVIHGNNTGDLYAMSLMAAKPDSNITYYGQDARLTLAKRHIFLVHYPIYARALATTGEWDVVCCGHNHHAQVKAIETIKGGITWYVNPGTVAGVEAPPTFILGDLEQMVFTIHAVEADRKLV